MSPDVTAAAHGILVTYRRHAELEDHLHRLARQTRPLTSLLVMDNAADPAIERLVAEFRASAAAKVTYRAMPDNAGPAGAFCAGITQVLDHAFDDDVITLLDDDDPPWRDDTFERLVNILDDLRPDHPEVGGVGVFGARLGGLGRLKFDRSETPAPVHYLSGAGCPTYTVAALRSAPGPDPSLFFGFEELDLGLALHRAGHSLWSSGLAADHGCRDYVQPTRASVRVTEPSWRRYYSVRNLIAVLRRDGRNGSALAVSALAGLGKPLTNLAVRPRTAWANLRLTVPAVSHAWRGRLGRHLVPPSSTAVEAELLVHPKS